MAELRRTGNDSDGNQEIEEEEEDQEKAEPHATQSQRGDLPSSLEHTMEPNLGTLAAVPSSSFVQHRSSDLLGNPSTPLNSGGKGESKETVGPLEKEIIAREAAQTTPTHTENQLQVSLCSTPLSEVNRKNPSGGKALSSVSVVRTAASDGYNWRKYGQKQVKSPTTGSRSYYRCTHSNCCAKKIECCDHSGHVIEIVYRSEHGHDPPRKTNSTRENKFESSIEPTAENSVSEKPIRVLKDSDPSISSKAQQDAPCDADKKQLNSSNVNGSGKVILKEEHLDEPEPKRRKEKGDLTPSDSSVKPGKKPKLVVHAAGDVGISGDGYRWRKYGQKMVKGNPHPRNYYRCTSAGCPVRKHIETAVDNSDAVIITYKGVHDHDMPVPKKRHGPLSPPLVAAAAPASMNNLQLMKPDSPQSQKISTKWSVDTEGELTGEALDLGGEKAIESARTLLSIGFEIKPC